MKEFYVVKLERPPGVTVCELERYIRDAVDCWKGGGDPESPICGMKRVAVRRLSTTSKVSLK